MPQGPGGVPLLPCVWMPERPQPPAIIRAVAFIDGQNLYRHAKDAFGYHYPNFDPNKLHDAVCKQHGWTSAGVRFYTGTPEHYRSPMWHGYWASRLLAMRRAGIFVFNRVIRYRTTDFSLPNGAIYEIDTAQEKGVDVRLAIDVMRLATAKQYDVAVIYSQDQDLTEVAKEIALISSDNSRWLLVASAFPYSPSASSKRGIDKTKWIKLDRSFYDNCLDEHDYRPESITLPKAVPTIRLKEPPPY